MHDFSWYPCSHRAETTISWLRMWMLAPPCACPRVHMHTRARPLPARAHTHTHTETDQVVRHGAALARVLGIVGVLGGAKEAPERRHGRGGGLHRAGALGQPAAAAAAPNARTRAYACALPLPTSLSLPTHADTLRAGRLTRVPAPRARAFTPGAPRPAARGRAWAPNRLDAAHSPPDPSRRGCRAWKGRSAVYRA